MAFTLHVANVFRDFSQGLYGNRIPFDDEDVLEIVKIWDTLVQEGLIDADAKTFLDDFEIGGAHPQVAAEFENRDFMEVYRLLRKIALYTKLRPLDRAANLFLLKPVHRNILEHVLTHLAQDVANPKTAPKNVEKLLLIKIFDSQGIIEEIASTVEVIADLYHGRNKEGIKYLIAPEIAIPYSQGANYPDELYLQKVEDAYHLLEKSGIPMNACRISLKDMVGQLDAKAAGLLIPKIIKKLKKLQEGKGTEIPFGLHLHDTGHAKEAYVTAIEICKSKEMDYPLVIDTFECDPFKDDPFKAEYTGKNAYRNTGFVDLRDLNKACAEKGIDLGLTPGQLEKLNQNAATAQIVSRKYAVRRVESLFSGDELRDFDIPGGAFASFSTAVKNDKIAEKLELDERAALLLAGNALKAVALLMGYPFAVTPGFQNKQIAAINFINNMIKNEMSISAINEKLAAINSIYDMMKNGASILEINERLQAVITDKEVETLFLANLNPVVEDFLKGEMPADTLKKMGIPTAAQVHPKIREKLGRRTTLLTETANPNLLADARKVVERLDKEGLIKHTKTQEEAVRYEFQGQPEDVILKILKAKAIQTHITWALELGDPNKLEAALRKPWLREPNPSHHQGDKAGYLRTLDKSKKGINPVRDKIETRFIQMQNGKISLDTVYDYKQLVQEFERYEIWRSTLIFIKIYAKPIEAALASDDPNTMDELYEKLYNFQEKMISNKENNGEYFITSNKRRHDMALDFFADQLTQLNPTKTDTDFHNQSNHKKEEIESTTLKTPYPGKLLKIYVKEGDEVKAGDKLLVMESMKIQMDLCSSRSGVIEKISVVEGAVVDVKQLLITFKKETPRVAKAETSTLHDNKIDLSIIEQKLHQYRKNGANLIEQINVKEEEMDKQVANYSPTKTDENDLMTEFQKRGYYGLPLTLTKAAKQGHENEIHVIGNRDTSGIKLLTNLKQANCDVRLLYTAGDKDTPLIKYAKESEKILVRSYTEHEAILDALRTLAEANLTKTIYFHPGWGFLSEDADFVAALEQLPKNVVFVGPPSKAMRLVGGKTTCRHMMQKVAPEFNPGYFGCPKYSAAQIKEYIDSKFDASHKLHEELQEIYKSVLNIGGDVMIKAVAGGGGMGIRHFINIESDYQGFITTLHDNIAYSEKTFGNGEMLIEEFIGGKTRHLEVQLAVNDKGAIVFGIRDCTSQHLKGKTNEMNVIQGDYPEGVTAETLQAIKKFGMEMSAEGYRGLCTIELLVADDGTVIKKKFLEGNTRLQVEHPVTEEDIRLKTGKNISLPLINLACVREKNIQLADILKRDFDFTDADLMTALTLGTERVEHVRLNSFEIDVLTGNHGASFFWGYMWPGQDIIAKIAKDTGAHIIIGDIGAANYKCQTGAVWGTTEQVRAALTQINKIVEVARACLRSDGTLCVNSVFAFHELVFDDKGNFSKDFTTLTQDEFLEAVKSKTIKVEMDKQHLGSTPALKPGAMKQAFKTFLEKQAEHKMELKKQLEQNAMKQVTLAV